jgi:hypothetical protein
LILRSFLILSSHLHLRGCMQKFLDWPPGAIQPTELG